MSFPGFYSLIVIKPRIAALTIQPPNLKPPHPYLLLQLEMAPTHRIIIDTDPGKNNLDLSGAASKLILSPPGVDDVLAMLLALSAKPEELEILMISVTYGNVPLRRYGTPLIAVMFLISLCL